MVQTQPKLKTFDDYLAYTDGPDGLYELTNGELIEIPPESDENVVIARAMEIVDPEQGQVTVLSLMENGYRESVFVGEEVVESLSFEKWALTAAEMLLV